MKQCLPPVSLPNAHILILGSLPGEESLRQNQYYAHPRNHFWAIMQDVIECPLLACDYTRKCTELSLRRIALWDVVAKAERSGSLDQNLREVMANPLADFVRTLPCLRVIAFNGRKAGEIGRAALSDSHIPMLDLPSSSPANTLPPRVKLAQWMQLRAFLGD